MVVALAVALELNFMFSSMQPSLARPHIRSDRMVEPNRTAPGINLLRIAAQIGAGLAHDGEIDEHRHTREVLEQHARRRELHFLTRLAAKPAVTMRSAMAWASSGARPQRSTFSKAR